MATKSSSSRARQRRAVIARYGLVCAARDLLESECGGVLECHHLIYRSQGGKDDPENGLMLCTLHHQAVHARTVLVRRDWLWTDQVEYLSEKRWVWWDGQGLPWGPGFKGFAVVASR